MGAGEEGDPLIGVVLGGKYRLEKKVGEGGMGKIYLSRHITLNKRYAVKMLNPEYSNNQEAIERFRREAVTAGELEHPNIINVTDIDYTEEGQAYIVMEYLDGRELRDDLRNTPIVDTQRALRILYQVARALDAAHSKGIIHRDLKPENIFLIDRSDQKDVVKILDFGISKIKGARASNLTQTGMVIGTPHYMAPEQARGDREIDVRVDIFALGAIAYEMFTGRLPVNGESPTAILMKILLEEPPPPESINPNIHPGISAGIRKASRPAWSSWTPCARPSRCSRNPCPRRVSPLP
jgi:serine/threonine protein kinase